MSRYSPERVWPRLVPTGSVMVSVYSPSGEQAYGVIANISEGGAQIVSGVQFESDTKLLLRIGFDPDSPFPTEALVVWCRDESDPKHKSYVHGVRFEFGSEEQRAELRGILESPQFAQPVVPGANPTRTGLDNMMSDLSDELEQLGTKFQKET